MSGRPLKIAVVGATGAVGKQLLAVLEQRKFPVRELLPFASARSEGKEIRLGGKPFSCRVLKPGCFAGVDLAFFDASDAVSREWVPQAAAAGAWVVDNSATFRLEPASLLLVPEVNGELLQNRLARGTAITARERILTGPNCSTVQMVVALKPIRDGWGLRRVVVSTYQSTSGAGAAAMDELTAQTRAVLEGKELAASVFTHRIAFNCIPQIGGFKEDGTTSEELKMMEETRKLLALPSLRISATAVRVPTYSAHGETINVETERAFDVEAVRMAIGAQPGVILQDRPADHFYPLGVTCADDTVEAASGRDGVYVGRIRRDASLENGLNLWVVSDNLRKGAALNAVQIGEVLLPHLR